MHSPHKRGKVKSLMSWIGEMDLGCGTCGVKRCLADSDVGRGFGAGVSMCGGWVGGRWGVWLVEM